MHECNVKGKEFVNKNDILCISNIHERLVLLKIERKIFLKKYISLLAILFSLSMMLVACSDDDENDGENSEAANEETQEDNDENQEEDEEESDDLHEVDKGASDGDWGEDQLGLGIGDTATKSSNMVMAEITLDSVEKEEDDEAYYGHYTILHMTVKNIGDEAAEFEDIFDTTELSDGGIDESAEGGEIWEPETIDELPGEVAPGEEVSGALIFDVDEADDYMVYMDFGLESVSNKTTFEFDDEEIE